LKEVPDDILNLKEQEKFKRPFSLFPPDHIEKYSFRFKQNARNLSLPVPYPPPPTPFQTLSIDQERKKSIEFSRARIY